jgi:glycosyltransferase involved in cell wall biosynthesis
MHIWPSHWLGDVAIISTLSYNEGMKIAAITCAYNEDKFLPIWYNYYSQQLGSENLYVIDDGSSVNYPFLTGNHIKLPRLDNFSELRKLRMLTDLQKFLLLTYDVVIYSDADELIIPDLNKYPDLPHFLNMTSQSIYTTLGLEVVHNINQECALDWHKPLLLQRNWCRVSSTYCKPIVTRQLLNWQHYLHYNSHMPAPSTDLFLLHLKHMDFAYACEKHASNQSHQFNPADLEKNLAWHWRKSITEFARRNFICSTQDQAINFEHVSNQIVQLGSLNGSFDQQQALNPIPVQIKKVNI